MKKLEVRHLEDERLELNKRSKELQILGVIACAILVALIFNAISKTKNPCDVSGTTLEEFNQCIVNLE